MKIVASDPLSKEDPFASELRGVHAMYYMPCIQGKVCQNIVSGKRTSSFHLRPPCKYVGSR